MPYPNRRPKNKADADKLKAQRKAWKKKNPHLVKDKDEKITRANMKDMLAERAYIAERRVTSYYPYQGKVVSTQEEVAKKLHRLLDKQKNCCNYCGINFKDSGFHIDHIVPLVKGGFHDKNNLQLLCDVCNGWKSDRDEAEFLVRIQRIANYVTKRFSNQQLEGCEGEPNED